MNPVQLGIPHPFIDEVGAVYGAIAPQATLVAATEWLQGAVRDVMAQGLRPLVLTPDSSRLTFAALRLLESVGGAWVVHAPDGLLRDGISGRRYEALADAFTPVGEGDLADPAHLQADTEPRHPRLVVEVTVLHKAKADVLLGRGVELVTETVTGHDVLGWGSAEPAALHWNRENLTAFARSRMPQPSRLVFSAHPDAGTSGTLVVTRTASGVTETITQVIGVDGGTEAYTPALVRASQALAAIADEQQPLLGVVSGTWGRRDGTTSATLHPPAAPLALLIGPRAVRDLRIDVAAVTERFGAMVAGRRRIPAVVVPFLGEGRSQWEEFLDFGSTLAPADLARAFGVGETGVPHAS